MSPKRRTHERPASIGPASLERGSRLRPRRLRARDYPNVFFVDSAADDWRTEQRGSVGMILLQLETIRLFEQWLLDHEDLVHGPIHSSIGQEAVAVGACAGLRRHDLVTSTHRAHHHVLAKMLGYYAPPRFDPFAAKEPPESLFVCVARTLAEIMGLSLGWQGGRGGSMHLFDRVSGVIGTTAIVGGGIPIAAGAALAEKTRKSRGVALAFFGDGAVSIGAFHEGISIARAWRLPTVFLVENNGYSVATTVRETAGFDDLVIRAAGYDMPGIRVDGMDVLAVKRAVGLARQHAARGSGPVLIEAKTYRFFHQNGSLPGSAYGYRTKDEEAAWAARDPLTVCREAVLTSGICSQDELAHVRRQAELLVSRAADAATTEVDGKRVIASSQRPQAAEAARGVVSEGGEFSGVTFHEPSDFPEVEELSYIEAISAALHRAMERDSRVFVLGEDCGHFRGGTYGATKQALESFPDRVLSTPISELGFSGVALGAAIGGLKPVVEIMFPDFALPAADQLFNHIAKARYMYGGELAVPLVLRIRTAQGRGYGPQHSADPAGIFGLFPGWRIVAPSTPGDYVGLFNAAILSEDPVLIIEHHRLWQLRGPVPKGNREYVIPFGRAARLREGRDVTVLSWSEPVLRALRIAEEMEAEGVSVEVLDLRSLDRNSLDLESIRASAGKTGAVVIVEDAARSHSIGVHIAERVHDELSDVLSRPVIRATGKDVPTPVSRELEEWALLADEDIRAAIRVAAAGRRSGE